MDRREFYTERQRNEEFLRCVKKRSIEQKFLYDGKSGDTYLQHGVPVDCEKQAEKMINQIKKHISLNERLLYISLGCGDARVDKALMASLYQKGYAVDMWGVDVSEDMLSKAETNLGELSSHYALICADILSSRFQQEIIKEIEKYDNAIFAFLGSTIGNMQQTEIMDTLYNTVKPGQFLWIEAHTVQDKAASQKAAIFKEYLLRTAETALTPFFMGPLADLGITTKDGELGVADSYEKSSGTQVIRRFFRMKVMKEVQVGSQKLVLLPEEELELIMVRIFHHDTFVSFVEAHDFEHLDSMREGRVTQMLFKKK